MRLIKIMFRRLIFVFLVMIFVGFVRHAPAQSSYKPRDLHDFERGYTDEDLALEKRLLGNKSRSITWEALPLIEYPRAPIVPGSPEAWALVTPGKELPPNKFEAADKRFVEAKLKGRTFQGSVRIARKEPSGEKFTIYAKEPSRPKATDRYMPPLFAMMWPPYFCQWQSDSDQGFPVGENVDIVGKIEDLKEEGKTNTLFLKNVEIAREAAKEKTR